MAQLLFASFKKKIYNAATPTNLIAAGDTVSVRLRAGCCSCFVCPTDPNVPAVALGCDNLASQEAHSAEILARQISPACVGDVVDLLADSVTCDGRGFTWDRTLVGQDFRVQDIDMVMPNHDGVGCPESSV